MSIMSPSLKMPPEKRLLACQDLDLPTYPLQDRIVTDPHRFLMFRAARQIGKSYTIVKRHWPMSLCRDSLHWIVGPTYDLADKEFTYWLDFLTQYCTKFKHHLPDKPIRKVTQAPANGDLYIETAWGAKIIGKSATNVRSLVGESLDSLVVVEAAQFVKKIWQRYLRPTIAKKMAPCSFAGTPDPEGMWLYELETKMQSMEHWVVYHETAWSCPHFPQEDVEEARATLDEDAFYEQYGGEWRFYAGRVYKMFNEETHVVEPFEIPRSWKIVTSTDFGYRDPMATIWGAQSNTGEVYLFGEYYEKEQPTDIHVAAMMEIERSLGVKSRAIRIADHHGLGIQLIRDISRHGWITVPCGSHDRTTRRDRSLAAFTSHDEQHPYHIREAGKPPGRYPTIFLMRGRCPNLQHELLHLRFAEGKRKEGSYGDVEGANHAVDDVEYIAHFLKLGMPRRVSTPMSEDPRFWQRQDRTGYYYHERPQRRGYAWATNPPPRNPTPERLL